VLNHKFDHLLSDDRSQPSGHSKGIHSYQVTQTHLETHCSRNYQVPRALPATTSRQLVPGACLAQGASCGAVAAQTPFEPYCHEHDILQPRPAGGQHARPQVHEEPATALPTQRWSSIYPMPNLSRLV
jgi:hypothetical protein